MTRRWYRITNKSLGVCSIDYCSGEVITALLERPEIYEVEPVVVGTKEEFDYELGKAYDAGFAAGRNYEDVEG